MVVIEGIYENGVVKLEEEVQSKKPLKVMVTFLEETEYQPIKRLTMGDFSFTKTRNILKNVSSSLSDELIKERREG